MKKILLVVIIIAVAIVAIFLVKNFKNQAYIGTVSQSNVVQTFVVNEGEGVKEIGVSLEEAGLIKNKYHFYYYIWKTKSGSKLQAGEYELTPNMNIQQISEIFADGKIKVSIVKMTIPEGFNNKKIIARLEKNKPELSEDFKKFVNCKCLGQGGCECDKFSSQFKFLQEIPAGIDMEGYLFPDTYFIKEEDTSEIMVAKFLNNFGRYLSSDLLEEIENQGKTLHEIITMASIIEREARTNKDRKVVSGIFWDRIEDEHALQSCATLAYFLGTDKMQFSFEETRTDSPYNTYINPGLPPGPICNPGLESIRAAIYPEETDYYYFLSNPETGEMVYSKTIDEHNRNKDKNGL